MDSNFVREERYVVFKLSKVELNQRPWTREKQMKRVMRDVPEEALVDDCVVVESDWPEYEVVWGLIQARVEGKPNEIEALKAQLAERDALIAKKDEALWLAHEHAKLNFGGQYIKGQNVYNACDEALALKAGE